MLAIGPGRYSATAAIRSSNRSGRICRSTSAHALAFQLEHPGGVAPLQHLVGHRIVKRQRTQIDGDVFPRQEAHRALQDGQRGQTQEVELHQPGLLDNISSSTASPGTRISGRDRDRHHVDQPLVADHHAGGMGAGRAGTAPPAARRCASAGPGASSSVRIACSFGSPSIACCKRHRLGRIVRDQLGDLVHLPERQPQQPAPHRAPRRAPAAWPKGDDLRHPVRPVFPAHIGDHLVAPVLAEIDVEIPASRRVRD